MGAVDVSKKMLSINKWADKCFFAKTTSKQKI